MPRTTQLYFLPELQPDTSGPKPVNVASVPQRSPFRYPGGKTWFVPTFRRWISHFDLKRVTLVEPFAGGGIVTLTALFENLVRNAVMVELDEDVAAVWQCVSGGDLEWLASRVLEFELTRESVVRELEKTPKTLRQRAFQTILKNRTLHGGILADGSSFIKHGENGKGIQSRWYPQTLAKRIRNLDIIADRLEFRHADGMKVIEELSSRRDTIFFIDPPYTAGGKKAGQRLYKYNIIDHRKLFAVCESLTGDFLMTYDNAEEVRDMAKHHGFQVRLIPMNNTHHATMEELVIGRDLGWMGTCGG